jgi:ubiquinone/menaquinone biosynthesis C-methylase UbiE
MIDLKNPAENLTQHDIADLYDELPLWSAPFGMELLRNITYRRGMKVLDIGCGSGFPLLTLSQRLGSTCHIYGLEPNEGAYSRAIKKINMMGLKNVSISTTKAEEMDFKDGFFDMICSNNGLNNVEDIEKSFMNCGRVAKAGCRLVYTMNLKGTMPVFYDALKSMVRKIPNSGLVEKIDHHIFTKRKPVEYLKNLTERSGFKIMSISLRSFSMNYLDGTAFLSDFLIRQAFMPLWKELLPEDQQQTIFNELEEYLNRIAKAKGFLELEIPFVCIVAEKE